MKTLKLYFPVLLFTVLLISSCAATSYIGDNLPATEKVDVYYAAKDVKREYKVIGHISSAMGNDENFAKEKIVERAKKAGADGVIILGTDFTGGKDSEPYQKADAIKYTN